MTHDTRLDSLKSICVEDLPWGICADSLRSAIRNHLYPMSYNISLLPSKAILSFNSHEAATNAIRELNGIEIKGKRIRVSLHVPFFLPSSDKKVHLQQIPGDMRSNAQIFDLFTPFGTIVDIDLRYGDINTQQQLSNAYVTFFTKEQAQKAIEKVNTDVHNTFGTIVTNTMELVRPPLYLPSFSNDKAKSNAIYDLSLTESQKEDSCWKASTEILKILVDSLDPHHLLECFTRGKETRLYLGLAQEAYEKKHRKIPQLTQVQLEVAQELDLASKTSHEKKLQTIREKLYKEAFRLFPPHFLNKILDIVLEHLTVPKLLELCIDETQFRLMAFYTRLSMAFNTGFVQPVLTKRAIDLVLQLRLDMSEGLEAWKRALIDHVENKDQNIRVEANRPPIREALVKACTSLKEFINLIEVCADPQQFAMNAFITKCVLMKNSSFFHFPLSPEAKVFFKDTAFEEHPSFHHYITMLKKHLIATHSKRYGEERLEVAIDKILVDSSNTSGFMMLLEMCAHPESFCVHMVVAEEAVDLGLSFSFRNVPDSVIRLVDELRLDELDTIDEWKDALKEYKLSSCKDEDDREELSQALNRMIYYGININDMQVFCFVDVLEMLADEERFPIDFVVAKYTLEVGGFFTIGSVSKKMLKVVRKLQLDKLKSPEQWIRKLAERLFREHVKRYGDELMKSMSDKILYSSDSYSPIHVLLDMVASPHRFRADVVFLKEAVAEEYTYFNYLPRSSDEINLVQKLQLDQCAPGKWRRKLSKDLQKLMYDRYDSERSKQVMNRGSFLSDLLFRSSSIPLEYANPVLFHLNFLRTEYSLRNDLNLPRIRYQGETTKRIRTLILEATSYEQLTEALMQYLTSLSRAEISRNFYQVFLEKMREQLSLDNGIYTFLDILFDRAGFSLYAFLAKHAKDASSFCILPVSDSVIDLVNTLKLEEMQSMEKIEQALYDYIFYEHKEYYASERLEKIANDLLIFSTKASDFHDLLNLFANKGAFRARFPQ